MSARQINSLTNPTVKAVRALHLRKEREESGLFLAEGLKLVIEAIDLGRIPRTLLFGTDAASHPLLRRAVNAARSSRSAATSLKKSPAGTIPKPSSRCSPSSSPPLKP